MALSSRSRQCLFCLPPVYGVLAFTYIWIICGIIIAIIGWSQVQQLGINPIPVAYATARYFHALLFSFMGIIGIYGVIAAFIKRPGPVLAYLLLLGLHLLLSVVGGGYLLAMVNREPSDDAIVQCLRAAYTQTTAQLCFTPVMISRGVAAGIYVVSWLFELYACIMIFSYLTELKQRNADVESNLQPSRPVNIETISEPTPIPNYKPATMTMLVDGYPASIIEGFASAEEQRNVGQLTWEASSPRPSRNSPPMTPVTPTRPDFATGIRPLMLTKKNQPSSPHVIPPINVSTSPMYGPGSAGLSTSYAFSSPENSFGSRTTTPTQAEYTNISLDNRF